MSGIDQHQAPSKLTEAQTDQYLTFMLNGEEYGVDILRVQEIKGWDSVTPLPNTPSYVRGVINLRGTIVPIIDLRERFHMQTVEYGPTTVIIVLKVISCDSEGQVRERITGVVVDSVSDVRNIPQGEIQPPPPVGGGNNQGIRGLSHVDEHLLILLDIDQLLGLDASGF